MSRRGFVMGLHWVTALLILILWNKDAGLGWHEAFVATGAAWLTVMAFGGPLGRPGPKLQGWTRTIYHPMHLALYAVLAGAVALTATAAFGYVTVAAARTAVLTLLCMATFHAIFHLWRHTALRDGALRTMTPRIWHKYL